MDQKHVEYSRRRIAIDRRYDRQEVERVGEKMENIRKDWTPAQKRRTRKKDGRARKRLGIAGNPRGVGEI